MFGQLTRCWGTVRRAFSEFLLIPVIEVAAFCALSWGAYIFDSSAGGRAHWGIFRRLLDAYVGTADNATNLLETVASSLITVSSITFSILLLAVQQSSAALTNQVVDQYLRRRSNQWFFGFFVGASIFSLNCLALTRKNVTPILATTLALTITAICVFALIVLIYSTLDQTRPASIISRIHGSTVAARAEQLKLLASVNRGPLSSRESRTLASNAFGYVTAIDVKLLSEIVERYPQLHIEVLARLGDPISIQQDILRLAPSDGLTDNEIAKVRGAVRVEKRRDLLGDPMFGVDQLGNIAWTSTSTAKSNPAAALVACHALNDLLWRWSREGALEQPHDARSRIYLSDDLSQHLACAYESLMVATSESMQHQTLAEIARGLSRAIPHMPDAVLDEIEDVVLRSISALGDHVPTATLEGEFEKLQHGFRSAGRVQTADKLANAWKILSGGVGSLHSRSDRVPG